MDNNEAVNFLRESFGNEDWFFDVEVSQGRLVVYTHFLSSNIMKQVPRYIDNKQVLLHFAASKKASSDSFVSKPSLHQPKQIESVITEPDEPDDVNYELEYLRDELARLESVCGMSVLESIFFERHDGKNALTNIGSKYPSVKEDIDVLYDDYGFDIIYKELDI
jgi:hypothetical protein